MFAVVRHFTHVEELGVQVAARDKINALKIVADFHQAMLIDTLQDQTPKEPQLTQYGHFCVGTCSLRLQSDRCGDFILREAVLVDALGNLFCLHMTALEKAQEFRGCFILVFDVKTHFGAFR